MEILSFLYEDRFRRQHLFEYVPKEALITDFAILDALLQNEQGAAYIYEDGNIYGAYCFSNGISKYNYVDYYGRENYKSIRFFEGKSEDGTNLGYRPYVSYVFGKIKDEFQIKEKIAKDIYRVTWGEYFGDIASIRLQSKLEKLYSHKTLEKTGKIYKSATEDYIEYIYKDKKYVRFDASQERFKKDMVSLLSNGSYVCENDYYWIQIEPLTLIVDFKREMALFEKVIITGDYKDRFVKNEEENTYNGHGWTYENSPLDNYLNDCLIRDIIPHDSKLMSYLSEEKNNPNEDIDKLIAKIYSYVLNDNNLKTKIDALLHNVINAYNLSLEKLKTTDSENILALNIETKDTLKLKLITQLESIINTLENWNSTNKVYYDLLNKLEHFKCTFLDSNDHDSDISLDQDLKSIKEISKFLESNDATDIKAKVTHVLNTKISLIREYLNESLIVDGFELVINHNTLEDFNDFKTLEHSIRKDLHPVLELLQTYVNKAYIKKIVLQSITDIVAGIYGNTNKDIVSFYLDLINKLVQEIKSYDNEEINNNIMKIVNLEIDYNENTIAVLKHLQNIIVKLYIVLFELEHKEEKLNSIENYKYELKRKK